MVTNKKNTPIYNRYHKQNNEPKDQDKKEIKVTTKNTTKDVLRKLLQAVRDTGTYFGIYKRTPKPRT